MVKVINLIIKALNLITNGISDIFKYREIYKLTGLVATRKFKPAKHFHKYAVLVAARNEATVIGNLIESINKQDYPNEYVKVFVVADNCTDNTAEIARNCGAVCYERHDTERRTKGFALQYLVECIRRDYSIESFEGYIIFDADNLLKQDFLSRMNDSFDAGEKIVTSYRNTKNFADNWISASYAIHWLRTIRNEHRARSFFHLATRIQGTGFLFSNELIKNGWNYTSLTEDRAFCADAVALGYNISYNHDAQFYDEQPVDIKIAMRQRIRWAKGHLQAFVETGPQLLYHIFVTNGMANRNVAPDTSKFKRFVNNIRLRFMSFDMLTVVFPTSLVFLIKKLIAYSLRIFLVIAAGNTFGLGMLPDFAKKIFAIFGINHLKTSGAVAVAWLLFAAISWTLYSYLKEIITAVYIFIIEYKRIIPIKWYKKIWFSITFPIFDLIGKISMLIALFIRVDWKPIPHNAAISIEEIEHESGKNISA